MKKNSIRLFIVLAILLQSFGARAQEDSVYYLTFEDYMSIVKEHHPVAMQAELELDRGRAAVRQARGGFDPKLILESSQKEFKDQNYYDLLDGGLKIPTWFGLDINTGYEQTRGVFLNPEANTPGNGLVYAGFGLTLGEGLFIDERRAQLRQAKIFRQSTEAMRLSLYNNLLFDAGKTYWDWFMAYHVLKVYENALFLANQRFDAVKQSAILGDVPPIDTLEAGIQVQNRRLALQQSRLDYANATALLNIYLWRDGEIPLEIREELRPRELEQTGLNELSQFPFNDMDSLIASHPDLRQYEFKIQQLRIEQRWKREQLKPTVDLKYNFIAEPVNNDPFSQFTSNNYTWGLKFDMPVLLRKERGGVLNAGVKVKQARFDYTTKYAELNFKVQAARNELQTTGGQYQLYAQTVRDYEGLLNGERTLFRTGESSLFLVNSRELGFINAQVKLIELLSKNQKAALKSNYALGILLTSE